MSDNSSRHPFFTAGLFIIAAATANAFTVIPSTFLHSPCHVRGGVIPLAANSDKNQDGGLFSAVGNFFKELDSFVDDATNRRLGNGSAFYGKRKSSFYGEADSGRKKDSDVADPTEDYQGPSKSGYFQWVADENGELKPVTRMRGTNIERNPNYWDRVYKGETVEGATDEKDGA